MAHLSFYWPNVFAGYHDLLIFEGFHENLSGHYFSIQNEHIKSSIHIMGPLYEKLFNLILDTGIVPETWTRGVIKPIFKQKGDVLNPENYRPITLLSCISKLFTGIISTWGVPEIRGKVPEKICHSS